jgi:hypothetical protein
MNVITPPQTATLIAPAVVRGKIIDTGLIEYGGRGGDIRFMAPAGDTLIKHLPLGNPVALSDLYTLKFADIVDYLIELGKRLDISSNPYLRQALEVSYHTAPVTPKIVKMQYQVMPRMFDRETIIDAADQTVGIDYLEGWVMKTLHDGRRYDVRAFGSRAVHIVAGNSPILSAITIIRNAVSRSDAIIKSPSNDPFTALAIARTMIDMAPDHSLTKHLTVAYWKGGDEPFESRLYMPSNVEKIVAWVGFSGLKHITRYLQPGIELVALDPKVSISIVGEDAFRDEAEMEEAAVRLAADVGAINQKGCVCRRIGYVLTGSDAEGLARANRFGKMVYEKIQSLPPYFSSKSLKYPRELKAHVDALRLDDEFYNVIGGEADEGAVIVCQLTEAVEFSAMLDDRAVNIVPVDSVKQPLESFRLCIALPD